MGSNGRPMSGVLGVVWERELAYECRALFAAQVFGDPADRGVLCGDKSGRARCLTLDGKDRWLVPCELQKPIYALALISFGALDPARAIVALGTAGGGVAFRSYLSGEIFHFEHGVGAGKTVSAMIFHAGERELWIGCTDGALHRLRFHSEREVERRPVLELGEPITGLVFSAGGARVAAMTSEGSIFELDARASDPPRERTFSRLGPIRAAASLLREDGEILALASGTALHCIVRDRGSTPRLDTAQFAGRISCLTFFERDGAAWLAAGANDGSLTSFRMPDPRTTGDVALSSFAAGSTASRFEQRVLRMTAIGSTLYTGLDNNQLRALAPRVVESPIDLDERANEEDPRAFRSRIFRMLEEASPERCYEILDALTRVRGKNSLVRANVAAMIRHADKYGVGGRTFSDKRHHLGRMARFDTRSGGEYLLDAALYRMLLEERRIDGQGTMALGAPITGVVRFEHAGRGELLVESYGEDGRAWLANDGAAIPVSFAGEGPRIAWLQHVFGWNRELFLFCRERGFSSVDFDTLVATPNAVPPPKIAEGGPRPLYVYSTAVHDDRTLITGGRFRDLHLLQLSPGALAYRQNVRLGAEDPYAPVKALAVRQATNELFAGCDDGSAYRLELDKPGAIAKQIWQSTASLRHALALDDEARTTVLSDSGGSVVFLAPSKRRRDRFDAVWSINFGAAITAMLLASPALLLVADSTGNLHALDPRRRVHLYSAKLEGGEARAVRNMVLLPRGPKDDGFSIAAGCFDHALRMLAVASPAERAKERTKAIARASERPETAHLLYRSMQRGAWFQDLPQKEKLEDVAAALASVTVQSPAPALLSLWVRYPSPNALEDLIRDLRALASSGGRVQDRAHAHASMSERLRLMFKAAAARIEEIAGDASVMTFARVVQTCHDLARGWGLESSSENRRIRRSIAHHFFAHATEKMLELFLSDALEKQLGRLRARPMRDLLRDHLLRHSDPSLVAKTIASIAGAVERDKKRKLARPMVAYVLPLLIDELASLIERAPWVADAAHRAIRDITEAYRVDETTTLALLLRSSPTTRALFFFAEREEVARDPASPVPEETRDLAELAFPDERGAEARASTLEAIASRRPGSLFENAGPAIAALAALVRVVAAFDAPTSGATPSPPEGLVGALETLKSEGESAAMLRLDSIGLARLVRCAELTIDAQIARGNNTSGEKLIAIYERLRDASDELFRAQGATHPRAPSLIEALFQLAFLHVQRRVRVELDLFAPMAFLPGQTEEEPFLLLENYVRLHHRMTRSMESVILRRSDRPGSIALMMLPQELSMNIETRLIRDTLGELMPGHAVTEALIALAEDIVAEVPSARAFTRPDLAPGGDDLITLAFDGRLAAALFFKYRPTSGPDPAQRALARTLPQVLITDALRTQDAHRQMAQIFHHISEPAQAMRWRLQTLTNTELPPEVVREYYRDLSVHVEESLFMLNNYHSFVRVRRGEDPPLRVKRFDLVEQVEFRRRLVGEKFKFQRKTIRPEYPAAPLQVALDPFLVGDIAQNLLDNACKYSYDGQEVILQIGASKNEVFITVKDKGIGVPQEMERSLFAFGTRGADPRVRHQQGLGIGLYMADTYARWMRGRIEYKRRKEETRFIVILPLSLEETAS